MEALLTADPQDYVLLGLGAYGLGSVPIALLVTAILRRSDLRSVGSGNLGVYNTLFNVGKLPGVLTLIGNAAVAVTAVTIARVLFPGDEIALLTAITAVTAGNMWQVFTRFRGSRGTTTLSWALLVSQPLILLCLLGTWILMVLVARRTTTATWMLHLLTPVLFGLLTWSWVYVVAGALLGALLELKRFSSPDDTVALGLFRRFGINADT